MDKPHFPSDSPFLTDADDRRTPRPLWSEEDREAERLAHIRAQVAEYEDIGDVPSVPRDFWPRPTAPMQLLDDEKLVPVPWWTGWVLPVLLTVALAGAIASCAFGGRS